MVETEGELKRRLIKLMEEGNFPYIGTAETILGEGRNEYPKVSQKWVPTKGNRVDWKTLCMQMEQKIIEFENFGKKWLGEK